MAHKILYYNMWHFSLEWAMCKYFRHLFRLLFLYCTIREVPAWSKNHSAVWQQTHGYNHSHKELSSSTRRSRNPRTDGLAPTEAWAQHHGVSLRLHVETRSWESLNLQKCGEFSKMLTLKNIHTVQLEVVLDLMFCFFLCEIEKKSLDDLVSILSLYNEVFAEN